MSIFRKKKYRVEISCPISGQVYAVTETEDAAFSKQLMGDGVMIRPSEGNLYAPCDAKVEMVFPTKHAIGLRLRDNSAILLHFGLDTVELNGNGFELFVEQGQKVSAGELLLKADLPYLQAHAKDDCLIMVATELAANSVLHYSCGCFSRGDMLGAIEEQKG